MKYRIDRKRKGILIETDGEEFVDFDTFIDWSFRLLKKIIKTHRG